MSLDEDRHGPGLKFPPPLLAVAVIAVALLIDWSYPLAISVNGVTWLSGLMLIVAAIGLALVALAQFIAARTAIEPWQPTTKIIDNGVFRYSRNPVYLAFCIATIGVGLVLNSWWVIFSLPALVFLLQRLVIRREEDYLAQKFGAAYLDYQDRVRRWF